MSEVEFEAWPSTPRLYRNMVITEKIDGTNACIIVSRLTPFDDSADWSDSAGVVLVDGVTYRVSAQSRKRLITPEDDNFGFAAWVRSRAAELAGFLGEGRHFGEWWGKGIQRGYDRDTRTFSLFNVERWDDKENNRLGWPDGLSVVPVLCRHTFNENKIHEVKAQLWASGSVAAPGYANPEGIIIWHQAARAKFKSTFDEFDLTGGKTWQKEEVSA